MSELFRKVLTKDRLPEETGKYDTDKERLEYNAKLKFWMINPTYQDDPKYWFEPVKEPTANEIRNKGRKEWSGSRIGNAGFITGYEQALKDLKRGK